MKNNGSSEKKENKRILKLWKKFNAMFVLVLLLLIFSGYSIFIACKLNKGYIPDEIYRYEVVKHFETTWGIPNDVPITLTTGEDLHRNPYLGYWIFGRVLNIIDVFSPQGNDWQDLVALRIANWLFSFGAVIFTYLISKAIIKNKWLQLLPVFMLTNTLMYVFLSGGVSYDNPVNLLCTAGIYFFIRVLKKEDFLNNSLWWMVFLSISALIKHTVLPLALIMVVFWIIFIIRNRKENKVKPLNKKWLTYCLLVVLLIFVGLNISLYGVNLIKFHSIRPSCNDTFSNEICQETVFVKRLKELGLSEKLSLHEAIKQGHPDPIRYTFDEWIREMLKRINGIMGGHNYFPIVVSYFHIALYWMALLGFRYIRKPSYKILALLGIFSFYAVVLIYMNYDSELVYGFNKYIALQGRYIFPVISIAYIMVSHILSKVSNKVIKFGTLGLLILLFLYGGPIRFIWYYNSVFADWFI